MGSGSCVLFLWPDLIWAAYGAFVRTGPANLAVFHLCLIPVTLPSPDSCAGRSSPLHGGSSSVTPAVPSASSCLPHSSATKLSSGSCPFLHHTYCPFLFLPPLPSSVGHGCSCCCVTQFPRGGITPLFL